MLHLEKVYKSLYFRIVYLPQFIDPISTWALVLNFWFGLTIENWIVFFPQKVHHCADASCTVTMTNKKL